MTTMYTPSTGQAPSQAQGYIETTGKTLDQMGEQELVQLNDSWFNRVIENRRHVERDALLNIAFLLDHHYVSISKVGRSVQLTPVPEKKGRVRTVEQIIEPAVRSEMARLLRTKPQGVVIPQGEDPEDYEAASAADDGLQYVLQNHGVDEYIEQAVMWLLAGGTSHLAVHWNSEKEDDNGNMGDYEFRSLSPFEIGVPQLRKWRLQDQQYVMVTKAYEVDEIYEKWGIKVSADRNEKYGSIDDRLTSIVSSSSNQQLQGRSTEDNNVPTAIVKETWIKPSKFAPDGAVLITSAGTILDLQVWPKWAKSKYPFYKIEYMRVPGSYWAKPMITSLVPVQRRHNRATSVVVEAMNVVAQTRLAVPRNTQVKGALGGRGVLFEMPMGATQGVTNVSPPDIGNLPFNELESTRMAVQNISHQHEVSRGSTPPNVRSGTAINALKELDDTASVIPVRSIERATQDMGRHILAIMQEMWDEARLIYVLGEHGDLERRSFIKGDEVSGQFVVQAGSTFPYSKQQRQEMVMRNLEMGLITPEEALRYQDMGTPRGILRERELVYRHARRENQKFQQISPVDPATGQPSREYLMHQFRQLMPADWHQHEVHIQEHNKLRMSPAYENWPSWRRALFEAHITGHQASLQAQLEVAQGVGQPPAQSQGGQPAPPQGEGGEVK